MVIWKYKLETCGQTLIEVPRGAQCLHVGLIDDEPYVWCYVDELSKDMVIMNIFVMETGAQFRFTFQIQHIGTVQFADGTVFHYFRKPN